MRILYFSSGISRFAGDLSGRRAMKTILAVMACALATMTASCWDDNIATLMDDEANWAWLETVYSEKDVNVYFEISDTGMTDSIATGDDSFFVNNPNPISFSEYNSGSGYTITDNTTGLTWTKCTMLDSGIMDPSSDCSGTQKSYNSSEAKTQCANLSFAGNTDWRLPSASELFSIMNFDKKPPERLIDSAIFPNTNESYWTKTPSTWFGLELGWVIHFDSDKYYIGLQQASTTDTNSVRCVRGPE